MKRNLKTRPLHECRCDERLKTKDEESTCLTYTVVQFVYYESIKRELNKRLKFDSRCDTRLKDEDEGCTRLATVVVFIYNWIKKDESRG
jgi:hypothetical protein